MFTKEINCWMIVSHPHQYASSESQKNDKVHSYSYEKLHQCTI